jgi:hypothetical protein
MEVKGNTQRLRELYSTLHSFFSNVNEGFINWRNEDGTLITDVWYYSGAIESVEGMVRQFPDLFSDLDFAYDAGDLGNRHVVGKEGKLDLNTEN